MFNNSKYGNILTIILIIAIITIVTIIAIIGYRIYKSYHIDSDALAAASEIENMLSNQNQISNENVITNKTDISGIEDFFNNTTQQQQSSNGVKTKYKGYDVAGTIQIPSINVKYPILEQLGKKSLETSVVLLYTSNGLNEIGNSVIIGHNYRNGTMFSNVKKLTKGSIIYITDMTGRKVKYTVYNIYRTSGSDGEYITRNTNGKREISLSTCTDDSKARTIVLAKEN